MLLMCDQVRFPKVGIVDFDAELKRAPKGRQARSGRE